MRLSFFIFVTECSLFINETVGTSHGFIFLVNIAEQRFYSRLKLSVYTFDDIGGKVCHLDIGFELGIFKHIPSAVRKATTGTPKSRSGF